MLSSLLLLSWTERENIRKRLLALDKDRKITQQLPTQAIQTTRGNKCNLLPNKIKVG